MGFLDWHRWASDECLISSPFQMGRFILVTTSLFHYYILNMWGNIVYLFKFTSLNQEEPRDDLLQRLAKDPRIWIWMRLFGCLLWKDGRVRELSVQKGRTRIFVIKTLLFYLFERFTTPPCRCLYIPNSLKSGMAMWLSMAKNIWEEMNSMIFPSILKSHCVIWLFTLLSFEACSIFRENCFYILGLGMKIRKRNTAKYNGHQCK